jgi:hypothetical protein
MKETNLEVLFRKSFTEPSERNNFYIELLKTKLILLTPENDVKEEEGIRESEENESINFIIFEEGIVPIFSSISKIYEDDYYKNHTSIMAILGKDLFNFLKGRTFVLNPFSDYRRKMEPGEIEQVLDIFS